MEKNNEKRCINPMCNKVIVGKSTMGLCKRCSSNVVNTFGALALFGIVTGGKFLLKGLTKKL